MLQVRRTPSILGTRLLGFFRGSMLTPILLLRLTPFAPWQTASSAATCWQWRPLPISTWQIVPGGYASILAFDPACRPRVRELADPASMLCLRRDARDLLNFPM